MRFVFSSDCVTAVRYGKKQSMYVSIFSVVSLDKFICMNSGNLRTLS